MCTRIYTQDIFCNVIYNTRTTKRKAPNFYNAEMEWYMKRVNVREALEVRECLITQESAKGLL